MHIIFSCVPTCAVLRSMIRFFSVYDLYFSISSPVVWTGAHLDDRRSSSDSLSHPPGPRLALILPLPIPILLIVLPGAPPCTPLLRSIATPIVAEIIVVISLSPR